MTRSVSVFATCGVAALLALASGCASAPAGKQFVKVDSSPAGATITVDGQLVTITHPSHAIAAGLALVPEDRKAQGIIVEMTIRDNIAKARALAGEQAAERG